MLDRSNTTEALLTVADLLDQARALADRLEDHALAALILHAGDRAHDCFEGSKQPELFKR